MAMTDTYFTLEGQCEGLFKAKGSKHFGYGFPVVSEEEVALHLMALRKQHHAARHVAYAWRLGYDDTCHRANDDGEPNNSAGPPILGVIRAHDLTNVLFAVVRYFGGTKLGVSGLIEAYREGAAEALRNGNVVERIRTERIRVSFSYENMGVAMGLVKKWGLEPVDTDFQLSCTLDVEVRLAEATSFKQAVLDTRLLALPDAPSPQDG